MQRCHVDVYPNQGGQTPPPGSPEQGTKAFPPRAPWHPHTGVQGSPMLGTGHPCITDRVIAVLGIRVSAHRGLGCPHTRDQHVPTLGTEASLHQHPGHPHTADWDVPALESGHPHPGHWSIPTAGTAVSPTNNGSIPTPGTGTSPPCPPSPVPAPCSRSRLGTGSAGAQGCWGHRGGTCIPRGQHCPVAAGWKSGWGNRNASRSVWHPLPEPPLAMR